MNGGYCGALVEKTATALNDEAVMLMLLAVTITLMMAAYI